MAVTREEVLHVAKLARLRLDDDEVARLADELNGILRHIEALAGAALDEVAVVGASGRAADDTRVSHPVLESPAPLRDDVRASDALAHPPSALAPDWRDGFFVVPRLAALGVAGAHGDAQPGGDGA